MVHAWERRDVLSLSWLKNKQVKKQFGRTRHRCVDDIKVGLKKQDSRLWTGFMQLSIHIGISGRILQTQEGTFRFHKMRGIS